MIVPLDKAHSPFGLVTQMATAWNDQMAKHWVILRASRTAPGLIKSEAVDEAMLRGLEAEKWREFWYVQ